MMPNGLTLYELAGANPELRFSPHCWKARMALVHKRLQVERIPWRFTDKPDIAFSGQGLVPVLVHDGEVVSDSWRIAAHIEQRFPDRPSLFGASRTMPLAQFINAWSDTILLPAIARIILVDIYNCIDDKDRTYFRSSREARFGKTLESVVADRPAHLTEFRNLLTPMRRVLRDREFLAGSSPAYADYCVFGMFMWARCSSQTELLAADDAVTGWRDRLLDAFDGYARSAPCVAVEGTEARP
jgi:glutathione S-transferase